MEKQVKQRNQRKTEEDAEILGVALKTRRETISKLKKFATEADKMQKKAGKNEVITSGVGIGGGLMIAGSGIATFCTAGAALPFLAGAAGVAGTVTSISGGGASVILNWDKMKKETQFLDSIKKFLKKDDEAMEKVNEILVLAGQQEGGVNREQLTCPLNMFSGQKNSPDSISMDIALFLYMRDCVYN